ncbi:MAG: 50S ribosomal protein L18 [Parvibaculales bacterium]
MSFKKITQSQRRAKRMRYHLAKAANGRARLSVYRSAQHIYAQIIDDNKGHTIATASTLEKEFSKGSGIEAAGKIGKLVAERSIKAGVKEVIFDRGQYLYHGRVKALAEAARENGLSF